MFFCFFVRKNILNFMDNNNYTLALKTFINPQVQNSKSYCYAAKLVQKQISVENQLCSSQSWVCVSTSWGFTVG